VCDEVVLLLCYGITVAMACTSITPPQSTVCGPLFCVFR